MDQSFETATRVRDEVMNVLLTSEADRAMFKLVYPFSPALIQALVAVSSALAPAASRDLLANWSVGANTPDVAQ